MERHMADVALREVTLITMKRKHVNLSRRDKYGHWWFEVGDASDLHSESYGWWPLSSVGTKGTFGGIAGELNGQTTFGGLSTRDPHHGEDADQAFHPFVSLADARTDAQIADCLRQFAQAYQGEWRWTLGKGQNCHTFQEEAMRHCGLMKRSAKSWW